MTYSKQNSIKRTIMLIWGIAFMLLSSTVALAAYVSITVTNVAQAKTNWCWAASIEMSADALGYSSYDQYDIVKYVKGTSADPYPNSPGSGDDYTNGMKYATSNNYKATESKSTITISAMKTEISAKRPIMMAWGYYSNGERTGGHANVIYAVDVDNNYVKMQDPDGNSYTYSYSELTSTSSRKYDKTIKISKN